MELIDEQDWDYRKYWVYEDPSWTCGVEDNDHVPLLAIILIEDMRELGCEFDEDPNPWWIELLTLPKPELMSQKFLDGVRRSTDGHDSVVDIIEYCGGIQLNLNAVVMNIKTPYIKDNRGVRVSDEVDFESFIDEFIKPQLPAIFGLIGFFLDAPWNLIGTTGWDSLREYIFDEDKLQATINRLKNNE